jgi:coproporphyrinogen III oxidase-like Fe-S oxidoreductase
MSSTEETRSRFKKKKKSRSIREEELTKEEKLRAEVISKLCEKYKCDIHMTSCYIEHDKHLQLNPARLQLWARDIV